MTTCSSGVGLCIRSPAGEAGAVRSNTESSNADCFARWAVTNPYVALAARTAVLIVMRAALLAG